MTADGQAPGNASARLHLSEELRRVELRLNEGEFTLGQVLELLSDRAYLLLIIILTLPFLTPIPLPGLSTPFGAAIALVALRMAFGLSPWLPRRLLQRRISGGFFPKVFRLSAKLITWLERWLRPRWSFLFHPRFLLRLHVLAIVVAGGILLLPLPIPFSNTFPAWVVLFLCAGILEGDGLAIVLGYLTLFAGLLYLAFLGEVAKHMATGLWAYFSGGG